MAEHATSTSRVGVCRTPWDLIVLGVVCLFIATIAFVPFGTNCTDTAFEGISCQNQSLVQSEGVVTIFWIAVPSLVVALLPVVIRHWVASVITASLFSILVVLGILTIGILVLPVALASWMGAACRMQSPGRTQPGGPPPAGPQRGDSNLNPS